MFIVLKGQIKSLYGKINGSLHGASKATPAVDKTGIYIGSDDGWFYKINHKGKMIWKTFFAKARMGVHGTSPFKQTIPLDWRLRWYFILSKEKNRGAVMGLLIWGMP